MFELFVYECFRFYRRGFLDYARNDSVYVWFEGGTMASDKPIVSNIPVVIR